MTFVGIIVYRDRYESVADLQGMLGDMLEVTPEVAQQLRSRADSRSWNFARAWMVASKTGTCPWRTGSIC